MPKKLIAKGTFEIKMNPQSQNKDGEINFGRFIIDKKFQGDLEGSSQVEMLSAGSDNGAGAYVAMEHVKGKLNGREGTFVMTHVGTMTKESQELTVSIVPECGTGQLSGITGQMTINIIDKKHFYELSYSIAE